MTERPILFSGSMVKAILDNRKTMTRRLRGLTAFNERPDEWSFVGFQTTAGYPASDGFLWAGFRHKDSPSPVWVKCPYGQRGDSLWVRETWTATRAGLVLKLPERVLYAADFIGQEEAVDWKWSPSILMPRWASRLTLQLTDVRVERLQEITEEDACGKGRLRIILPILGYGY